MICVLCCSPEIFGDVQDEEPIIPVIMAAITPEGHEVSKGMSRNHRDEDKRAASGEPWKSIM